MAHPAMSDQRRLEKWDAVVVGAGVIGSYTAYHLAKQGVKTILLEQFYLPHSRGSSNGQSRIFRNFYREDHYCQMMPEALQLWRDLEKESGQTLIRITGMLAVEGPPYSRSKPTMETMKRHGLKFQLLSSSDLKDSFPMLDYPDDHQGVLDKGAGVLYASKCVNILQEQFKKHGGVIRDGEEVHSLKNMGKMTLVATSKGRYIGKHIILCTGPWSPDLLQKLGVTLPLKTIPGRQFYFRARDPDLVSADSGMPVVQHYFIQKQGYQFLYVKPADEYPGYCKVASRGEPMLKPRHPNERDFDFEEITQFIVEYVKKHMPYLDPKPCIVDPGVYTMTPDKDYVIDRHPRMKNVVIATGFSGHGFKLAPVIGKLLMEMALDKAPSYDLSFFKMDRFASTKAKL